jgi:hypothetical protein
MKRIIFLVLILPLTFTLSFTKIGAQSATDEAEGVRERVKEKVEAAKKNPKAYIGSVTDKTEDTLQIQNDSGEIQLISINPDSASFAKIDKKTASADYDDIGIGDYIIAMGFANGNDVLEAKRVVITSQPESSDIEVLLGTVDAIDKKEVTLATKMGEFSLDFPKRWTGPEISELEENMPLISIGVVEDNVISIRTIHIATPPEE